MLNFIFYALNRLIWIYTLAIVVYVLLSWFPGAQDSKIGRWLGQIVEPFLSLFNFATIGSIGFGPVIAIIILDVIQNLINQLALILGA